MPMAYARPATEARITETPAVGSSRVGDPSTELTLAAVRLTMDRIDSARRRLTCCSIEPAVTTSTRFPFSRIKESNLGLRRRSESAVYWSSTRARSRFTFTRERRIAWPTTR